MSNFLITGCARSGTGYINKLFNTLGLPCGHESIFNRGLNQKTYPGLLEKWRNSNRGESSWYSAPFLFDLPKDIIIFHQIRDPFSVIKSILRLPSAGSTFLKDDSSGSKYVYSHCPDVKLGKSHAERALLYWIHWNTLIENELTNFNIPHFRYCINNLDVTTVKKMTNLLNFNISDDDIQFKLNEIPKTVNSRGQKHLDNDILWESLASEELLAQAETMYAAYLAAM